MMAGLACKRMYVHIYLDWHYFKTISSKRNFFLGQYMASFEISAERELPYPVLICINI